MPVPNPYTEHKKAMAARRAAAAAAAAAASQQQASQQQEGTEELDPGDGVAARLIMNGRQPKFKDALQVSWIWETDSNSHVCARGERNTNTCILELPKSYPSE